MRIAQLLPPLALVVVVSACSDLVPPPVSPTTFAAVPGGATSLRGRAVPNKTKYKNAGVQPTQASAGTVTLEGRALLSRDGSVQLEVTTGSLENGTSTGNIKKVLVGPGDLSFDPVPYNKLENNGYWSVSLTGFDKQEFIAVQATVEPEGSKKQVTVKFKTPVVLRPDLEVAEVLTQAVAMRNAPLMIKAVVHELNGDVGARGDCVLSIDGAQVDVAAGIWVDAADRVTCFFTHAFTAGGKHDVSIAMTNVAPGDWNDANNAATTTIMIDVPMQANNLYVSHADYTYQVVNNEDGFFPEYHEKNYVNLYSSVSYWGSDAIAFTGPFSRAEVTIDVDGATDRVSLLVPTGQSDNGTYRCDWFNASNEFAQMCTGDNGGAPQSTYSYSLSTGSVTYYGKDVTCVLILCTETNFYTVNAWGSGRPIGGLGGGVKVALAVRFVDATGMGHVAKQSVILAGTQLNSQTSSCRWDWDELANLCWFYKQTGWVFNGSTAW